MPFYPDPIDSLREQGLVSKTYPYAESSSPRDRQRSAAAASADNSSSLSQDSPSGSSGSGGASSKNDKLSAAEVGLVNKRAQMNATLTGVLGAFAVGLGARKTMRMTPNASVVIGIVSGSFIAYLEARTELARGMAALAYSHEMRTGKRPFGVSAPEDPELLRDASGNLGDSDGEGFEQGQGKGEFSRH
ncbi:hypothetical protein BCV69DRAFT_299742 [Microstroma glucosiphilum]|uniref:Uncharacterized protein n=1 Tax=Pseudomicrostroma glucosiphilum TaxID=1684307 RepID=A0A316U3X2_9BASI|nr:hypothetical protein BCV69DRAFT_299742 [Pseudomicrostroma glucosiphilum]PWN19986.1 hypothetical protein BCV69DRAFT_299742 [Pseudomicrostroma glucosiphilum]